MKNPGLYAFATAPAFIRPDNHPLWHPEDPDYDEEEDNPDPSDWTPRGDFTARWQNPGYSHRERIPTVVGPKFDPGATPEDVIQGEKMSPKEEEAADRIFHGEHESDTPSENPYVANAQNDLRTPGSAVAVDTLSHLLSGGDPSSVGSHMSTAHSYLSHHFTGVRVNPHSGTLLATSPYGTQIVKRETAGPLALREQAPSYSLTNRHGVFASKDPAKVLRTMVAIQMVHNMIGEEQRKKKDDDGLSSTSGLRDFVHHVTDAARGAGKWYENKFFTDHDQNQFPGSRFEPGRGTDTGPGGVKGGYVMRAHEAPGEWPRDPEIGIAYSPGHFTSMMFDPKKAVIPRDDKNHPGHKFTYMPTPEYPIQRRRGNVNYYVDDLHPAVRGAGFDHPIPAGGAHTPTPTPTPAPVPPVAQLAPKINHDYVPDEENYDWDASVKPQNLGEPHEAAVQMNDLCPVCASGYLEPYDSTYHECLNCGSLVKHIGFDKTAAPRRKPGGLGRGLGQIIERADLGGDSNPAGISQNDEDVAAAIAESTGHHPLKDEENQNPEEVFVPRKRIVGATDPEDLDAQLGKWGYYPVHKPGQERTYLAEMPGSPRSYARLTEGVPHPKTGARGWALTADTVHPRDEWSENGEPYKRRTFTIPADLTDPESNRYKNHSLPALGDHAMAEKSFIVGGHHPIDDPKLAGAVEDLATNGRQAKTYQDVFNTTAYEPPRLPPEKGTQQQRRLLSAEDTVAFPVIGSNPGLVRFVS